MDHVWARLARTIERCLRRACGIDNQCTLERLHDGQFPTLGPREALPQGIVSAGIEEELLDVHTAFVHVATQTLDHGAHGYQGPLRYVF